MLHGNSQYLVNDLEATALFEGRFTQIKLMNCPQGGAKRGFFSLVFRAYDELAGRWVALKFFDLDPAKADQYRLLSFDREHKLLEKLQGVPRCLQLVSPLNIYSLVASVSGGIEVTLPARYFAVDWLDEDIDDYFLDQNNFSAIEKLRLFNDVVLAVESLHSRRIFHRDLKYDNFRSHDVRGSREVVAIDLGTAARYDSVPIAAAYGMPVGMLMYAAPESFCGLAGNRTVAPLSDMFALGCMLFELFHIDDFPSAFRSSNPDYEIRFAALQAKLAQVTSDEEKLKIWAIEAPRLLSGLGQVDLYGGGSSTPPCILDVVSEMVASMTAIDFRSRWNSFVKVRQYCWRAVRVLENEAISKAKASQAAARRAQKAEKARRRAAALARPNVCVTEG